MEEEIVREYSDDMDIDTEDDDALLSGDEHDGNHLDPEDGDEEPGDLDDQEDLAVSSLNDFSEKNSWKLV